MKLEESLSAALAERHPEEAARLVERLSPEECSAVLRSVAPTTRVLVLQRMEPASGGACLEAWPEEHVEEILAALAPDVTARLLARIERASRESLLKRMPPEIADRVRRLLGRMAGSAGALMDPSPAVLPHDITVGEARKRMTKQSAHGLYYVYVVDRTHRLQGVMTLHELNQAMDSKPLSSIMRRKISHLSVHADRDAILAHPGWDDHHALPVLDRDGTLVGVLRYGTLRRLETEALNPRGITMSPGLGMADLYMTTASALVRGLMDLLSGLERRSTREDHDGI